jgi:hypothetical protein
MSGGPGHFKYKHGMGSFLFREWSGGIESLTCEWGALGMWLTVRRTRGSAFENSRRLGVRMTNNKAEPIDFLLDTF